MGTVALLLSIVLIQTWFHGLEAQPKPRPPPTAERLSSREKFTNKTIDQLITSTLGGIEVAASKILSPGDTILAELDLRLTQSQFTNLYEPPSSNVRLGEVAMRRRKRKAIRDPVLRWTNSEIPYSFARGHFSAHEMYLIKQAMTEWERYTCLKFRPAASTDRNVVHFQNGEGCNSQLGMVGGVQLLNLDERGCRFMGLYLHEIGHAIGLVHEHQLPNRDDYIQILYQNVAPHMRIWFNKYTPIKINNFDNKVAYEYSSVMHYGITAFAQDGSSQTIRALDASREKEIGRVYLKHLSFSDVQAVNFMYKCAASCPASVVCRNGGYVDQNCRCICPDGSDECTEGATSPKDDSCKNEELDWKCTIWANQGECERNEPYMNGNCRKACKFCGAEKSQDDKCQDAFSEEKCRKWQESGDCVANPSWMARNCKKTCKVCEKDIGASNPETACQDAHSDSAECQRWALDGECQVNIVWMSKNCARSCHTCDKTDVTDPDTGETGMTCQDQYDEAKCTAWASQGECDKNPTWMIPNCRKSCNQCNTEEEGECRNLHNEKQCAGWARDGECAKNPSWMKVNCRLACKACRPGSTDGGSTDSPTTRAPTTASVTDNGGTGTGGADCRNDHDDVECGIWTKFGHCDINPTWMKKHCKKSCKVCQTTSETGGTTDKMPDGRSCKDAYFDVEQCRLWAEDGQCAKNPSWMVLNCRRACRACDSQIETSTTGHGTGVTDSGGTGTGNAKGSDDCDNLYFDSAMCQQWADYGECDNNPSWMRVNCQKSCRTCDVGRDVVVTPLSESGADTDCATCGNSAPGMSSKHLLVALCVVLALLKS